MEFSPCLFYFYTGALTIGTNQNILCEKGLWTQIKLKKKNKKWNSRPIFHREFSLIVLQGVREFHDGYPPVCPQVAVCNAMRVMDGKTAM